MVPARGPGVTRVVAGSDALGVDGVDHRLVGRISDEARNAEVVCSRFRPATRAW